VTVQDFLAAAGDHYRSFQNGKNVQCGELVREAFVTCIKKHTPLKARIDGRIELVP